MRDLEVAWAGLPRVPSLERPGGPTAVVASLPAIVSVVGSDERYVYTNAAYRDWFGLEPAALAGRHVQDVLGREGYAKLRPRIQAALRGEAQEFVDTVPYATGPRHVHVRYLPQQGRAGTVTGFVALVQDAGAGPASRAATDLEDFVENANVGIHWVDAEGRIVWANRAELQMLGYEAAEYVGQPIARFHADAATIDGFMQVLRAGGRLEGEEARLVRRDGSVLDVLVSSSARRDGERLLHTRCLTFDNSARKRAEAEAAARTRQQAALVTLGRKALEATAVAQLAQQAVRLVAETLGHEFVTIVRADGDDFVVEAQHGWGEGALGARGRRHDAPQADATLRAREPVTVADIDREGRFPVSPVLRRMGIRAGITVPIGTPEQAWGVLGTHTRRALDPQDGDTAFLQTAASLVAGAIQRIAREADLVEAVRRAAGREAQQRAAAELARRSLAATDLAEVCRLATSSVADTLGHEFAAVLRWHPADGTTELVGEAGWGPGFLGARTPAGPDTHVGWTLRTGDAVVIRDLGSDPRLRGHEALRERGVVCGIGVPIPGEGGPWGVLNTHSRTHAPYTEEEPHFLHTVASIVASAAGRLAKEADLQAANARLHEADSRKTQFLAMVAHDLRTPLTAIQLRMHLLRQRSGEGAAADLDVLDRSLRRLDELAAHLLDVARLGTPGAIRLRTRPIDIGRLVQEAAATFGEQAARAGVTLEANGGASHMCLVDEARVQQVVVNLLANALKFTPAGGRVHVHAQARGDGVAITVADTGVGLAPDQAVQLFEPFSQLHGTVRGGTGLGLHIARSLVHLHGGTIEASSPGVGKGTTFTVWLPGSLAQPEAADGTAAQEPQARPAAPPPT